MSIVNVNYRGMLLGVAIGDAFLFGVEMQSRGKITEVLDFSRPLGLRFVNLRGEKHSRGYRKGDYSDDCEMTVGLIKALMDPRQFSQELLLEKWRAEYDEAEVAREGVPRPGHGGIKDYFEGEKTLDEVRANQSPAKRDYPGNAPPMRAVPLGLINSSVMNKYAIINADSTHPHPKARAASILVARAAEYMLVLQGPSSGIITYCRNFVNELDQETFDYLETVNLLGAETQEDELRLICGPQPIPYFEAKGKIIYGLPVDSMRTAGAALYILKHAETPYEALRMSAYFGGDVDSLGAITVGIMGGRHGLETIPNHILEKIENKSGLEKLADEFGRFLEVHVSLND